MARLFFFLLSIGAFILAIVFGSSSVSENATTMDRVVFLGGGILLLMLGMLMFDVARNWKEYNK